MKKIIFASALLLLGLSVRSQEKVTEFKVAPAFTVRMPLQGDSINQKGEKFGAAELLKTNIPLDVETAVRVSADTAGYVTVDKPEADNRLYVFSTHMRAERFMKGKLKVTSPARFEVFVNGKCKRAKTTAEDSLSQVQPMVIDLRLEPEADYEVAIKLLSTAEDKAQPNKEFAEVDCRIAPDLKRRLSLFDTNFGSRVASVSLSPDGKYLLTRYSDNYDLKRSRSHTELTEVKTGRVLLPNANEGMRWMAKGSRLYYTVTGREGNDLLIYDPATGQETVVRRDIPQGYFTWSPNEDYLIYTETAEGEKVNGPLKRLLHPDDRIPGSRNRYYLVKYDLATGLSERLNYGSNSVYLNDISPDGTKLLCTAHKPNITKCPFSLTSVFQLDLATLQADTLVKWDAYVNGASYSPDGTQLLLTGSPSAFGGIGKNCGDLPIANDFDVQAFLMDLATKEVTPITRDFNPTIINGIWNRADGCIYFNTTDKDCQHIYRYDPKKATFVMLDLEQDVINNFSLPDDNATLMAYVGGGNTSAGVAYLYDRKKGKSTLLANPMQERLDEIELGEMQPCDAGTAGRNRVGRDAALELHRQGWYRHRRHDVPAPLIRPAEEVSAHCLLLWGYDTYYAWHDLSV